MRTLLPLHAGNDRAPWDHLDYASKHLISMQGSIDIEVNELTNSGQVVAELEIDLWVRSKEQNTNNLPPFETFVHLSWEEVTWK